jgi:DNA-binding beta-propeller fold protein YncE
MVADLLPPILFCKSTNTVSFINTEGVELFQIGRDKTGSYAFDTVHMKDNNSIAVSSAGGDNICIVIIDIDSQKVMITIPGYVHL